MGYCAPGQCLVFRAEAILAQDKTDEGFFVLQELVKRFRSALDVL